MWSQDQSQDSLHGPVRHTVLLWHLVVKWQNYIFILSFELKLKCFICSHILIVLLCSSYRLKIKQDPVLHLPPDQTPQVMRVLAPRRLVPLSVVASSSCEERSRRPALQTSVTLNSYILPEFITFFSIILLILMFLSRLCKLWRPNPECQCACVRYSRAERACWPAVWLLWIIQLDVNKHSILTDCRLTLMISYCSDRLTLLWIPTFTPEFVSSLISLICNVLY